MNPKKELTGTTEEVAEEIASQCVRMDSYTPGKTKFNLWIEFEQFCHYNDDFELNYSDYKNWLIWGELQN